ncbi:MAG: AAA family ATPase [bacterium]
MFNLKNKSLGRNLKDVSDVFFSLGGSKKEEKATSQEDKTFFLRRPKRFARVIPITSGKGGTGKSMVTSNLSIELVKCGKKTVIIDADLGLANLHLLMGKRPRYNIINLLDDNKEVREIVVKSAGGVKLVAGASGITELANLTLDQRKILVNKLSDLEKNNDIILVDTGAGIHLNTLMFLHACQEMIVVTNPDITAITDAYAVIKTTVEYNKNVIIGVIVNKTKKVEDAQVVYNKLSSIALKFLNIHIQNYGFIFEDDAIGRSILKKIPVSLSMDKTRSGECLKLIGQKIALGMDKKIEDIIHRQQSYFGRLSAILEDIGKRGVL